MTGVDPVDWRDCKVVTPVKNQGMCGSCWAFSTTGSMESFLAITTKTLPNLSEQELVDCSRSYGNYGCNGGLMTGAYNYIKDHKLATEKDYPYKARTNRCARKDTGDRYTVSSYQVMTRGNANVSGLTAMLKKGPVSVAIEVRSDFQLYHSGVYAFKKSCGRALNHGVLLVG
jgi:C1A family cysteine protease